MNAFSPFGLPLMTVSPDMQLRIPREVVEFLHLRPGQEVRAMTVGGAIELVPMMSLDEAQGFARGIDPSFEREPDRTF